MNTAQKYKDLKAVHWQYYARLGAQLMVHDMHDLGYRMSERTVGRMLKHLGLCSKIAHKYKHTTDSDHRLPTAPNLLNRQFTALQPNKVWTIDVTYIRTKAGWLYLCVMIHSDQGSQYCSRDFRVLLRMNQTIQSMSRRSNCWDNAVTESFFHMLKGHIIHVSNFTTRQEANTALFEYIKIYYNQVRRHSAIG